MSFDNDLKQAFERHAGDVSPTPGAWTGVERRIRRSHRVRAALASAGGATAIVAAVFAIPAILRNETAAPPAPPPVTQPPTLTEDKAVFRNERDGYWLQYPKDWRFGEFEAHVSFRPPGLPGLEEGGETFAVELWVDAGRYDDPDRTGPLETRDQPAQNATVAGRSAKVSEAAGYQEALCQNTPCPSQSSKTRVYYVDWTGYGCPAGAPCPVAGPSVLVVSLQATMSEEPLWDRFGAVAENIVESIRVNNASTMPSDTAVATRRGSVDSNVGYDETTAAVVRFMEARIEGGGAEPSLTSEAKRQYDTHDTGLSLYSPNERTSYVSYKVVAREQPDANSWEFFVEISTVTTSTSEGPETRGTFREILGVGPSGGSPWMIRFAMREA